MKQKVEASVRFILKNPHAKKKTAIYMIYAWGYKDSSGKYKPLKYSTGQSVDPGKWEKGLAVGGYAASINNELAIVKTTADTVYLKLKDNNLTPELLKTELDIALGRTRTPKKTTPELKLVRDYLERYVDEITSGERKTFKDNTKLFSRGTVRGFASFLTNWKEFEGSDRYTFEDIDKAFYNKYTRWLNRKYKPNTVGTKVKKLKIVMAAALDDDVHTNLDHKKKWFKVVSELSETVYLTREEIQLLYEHECFGGYEKARDLFLVGCFTAQRLGDWHKLGKVTHTVGGVPVFKITQSKTGAKVTVPFVDSRFIAIMEKYNYELPKLSEQKVRDYIKVLVANVADMAGNELMFAKAKDTATHTARRSACTNMYLAGISPGKIMKISGHKTESEFKKYIRMTDDEVAEDLATHEYFNN